MNSNHNIAKRNGFASVKQRILLALLAVCFAQMGAQPPKANMDGLIQEWQRAGNVAQEVEALYQIAKACKVHHLDSLSYYAAQLQELATVHGDPRAQFLAYESYGSYYFGKARHRKSLEYYNQALEQYQKLEKKNPTVLFWCYNDIAGVHYLLGDHLQSIHYLQKAMDLAHAEKDKHNSCLCENNIADIYLELGIYRIALDHFSMIASNEHCDFLAQKIKMKQAVAHRELGQFDSALHYARAMKRLVAPNDKRNTLSAKVTLASIYYKMDDARLALAGYNKALEMYDKGLVSELTHKSEVLLNSARLYLAMGKKDSALVRGMRAHEHAKANEDYLGLYESAHVMHLLYEALGQRQEATKFANIATDYFDSLNLVQGSIKAYPQLVSVEQKLAQQQTRDELEKNRIKFNGQLLIIIFIGMLAIAVLLAQNYSKLTKARARAKANLDEKLLLDKKLYDIESSISSDLHDNFGNRLSGIIALFEIAKQLSGGSTGTGNSDANTKKFQELEQRLMALINDIRDLLWSNNSMNAKFSVLSEKLGLMAQKFNEDSTKKVAYSTDHDTDYPISRYAVKQLLFAFKDILFNFEIYAQTKVLHLSFTMYKGHLSLIAENNTKGYTEERLKNIEGIAKIRERIEALGLLMTIIPKEDEGVILKIHGFITAQEYL